MHSRVVGRMGDCIREWGAYGRLHSRMGGAQVAAGGLNLEFTMDGDWSPADCTMQRWRPWVTVCVFVCVCVCVCVYVCVCVRVCV